eukprot:jgi/Chrzof1/2035/UNPLg00691.t1
MGDMSLYTVKMYQRLLADKERELKQYRANHAMETIALFECNDSDGFDNSSYGENSSCDQSEQGDMILPEDMTSPDDMISPETTQDITAPVITRALPRIPLPQKSLY